MVKRIKQIDWHKGSGSILLGLCFCVVSLMMCLLIYEYCNVYCSEAFTQTRTDLIADGAAEYANEYGELDENKARDMAQQLAILNSYNRREDILLSVGTRSLDASNNYDATLGYDNTVDIVVRVENPFLFQNNTFETKTSATTRIVPVS
ncbi:MAG: hypothetical protein IJ192_12470 [Clostridia bacterium]|nr:hypothetical protein [Clostridia bacterium]